MGSTLITPLYGLYRREFGFSAITLTLVYAVYVVGNIVALLFFGRISDQLGRRRITIPALALAAGAAVIFLFAGGTSGLFWARLLSGFAIGISSGTGTAWLTELYGAQQRARATVAATCANLVGVAAGPLLAGVLAQYAPRPLQLSFVVYLGLLLALAIFVFQTPETVDHPLQNLREVNLRPRLGVPAAIRVQFIAPAVTVFVSFALAGFYFALVPGVLSENLHVANVAVAGAVVGEFGITAILAVLLTRELPSKTAMRIGLITLLPALALLVLAQTAHSMPLLLLATAVVGAGGALGYRGSLQVVNQIAPNDQRAEVVSTYFIACFVGNSVPVIGVGVLTTLSNAVIAGEAFATTLGVLVIAALIAAAKYRQA